MVIDRTCGTPNKLPKSNYATVITETDGREYFFKLTASTKCSGELNLQQCCKGGTKSFRTVYKYVLKYEQGSV